MSAEPDSIDQVVAVLRSATAAETVLPVGARTKPRLSDVKTAKLICLRKLTGVTGYEPSEFTFTALAGTPVKEIQQLLLENGQYLPFDPMFVDAGATLGGTVAAGMSGAGQFRFGGVRDFLLGVRLVTGDGQLISAGGKVVKNAAGFDIPRLMVGSLGRLGTIVEMTFKVFPNSETRKTVSVACASHEQAIDRLGSAASAPWELDAIDYRPAEKLLLLRIASARHVAQSLVDRAVEFFGEDAASLPPERAEQLWRDAGELAWAPSGAIVVKVPTTPRQFLELHRSISGLDSYLSAGGATLWLAFESSSILQEVDSVLDRMKLGGLVIRGDTPSVRLGHWHEPKVTRAIQIAMDPANRFPDICTQ